MPLWMFVEECQSFVLVASEIENEAIGLDRKGATRQQKRS